MKGFEMGKGNRDQNTIRPYKGALHGEDWDSYIVDQMKRLREMKSNNKYKQYKEDNFRQDYGPNIVAIISGGFDPIHAGHLALIKEAATIGKVHILLNSDDWLKRKKGRPFLNYDTRADILAEFMSVHAISPVDDRDGTVVEGLKYVQERYSYAQFAFLNGGDRKQKNTPERDYCEKNNIELMWGIGGEKQASSSELLEAYNFPFGSTTVRPWGEYEVLEQGQKWRAKILRINPGQALSLQRHFAVRHLPNLLQFLLYLLL